MMMLTSTATPTWTMPEIAIFVYLCGELCSRLRSQLRSVLNSTLCIQLWSQHRLKKQEQLNKFPSLSLFYRVPFLLSSSGSARSCAVSCAASCSSKGLLEFYLHMAPHSGTRGSPAFQLSVQPSVAAQPAAKPDVSALVLKSR